MIIILSVICIILLLVVVRLWLAISDYQRTIDEMESKLRQYDTLLRATSTWLEDEMGKRNIPDQKKYGVMQIKVCKN